MTSTEYKNSMVKSMVFNTQNYFCMIYQYFTIQSYFGEIYNKFSAIMCIDKKFKLIKIYNNGENYLFCRIEKKNYFFYIKVVECLFLGNTGVHS